MSPILATIRHFLNGFSEIVENYLLARLPPLRSISHQIDLMPRSCLPNKEPYWITPVKSEEMNKQM